MFFQVEEANQEVVAVEEVANQEVVAVEVANQEVATEREAVQINGAHRHAVFWLMRRVGRAVATVATVADTVVTCALKKDVIRYF